MNFGIVFVVFVLQAFLALVVVVFLKKFLGRELIEVALERFETLKYQGDLAQLKEIVVVSHKALDESIQTRIKAVAGKRFKGVPLNFSTDSALKGGLTIVVGSSVIDNSTSSRLNALWGGK